MSYNNNNNNNEINIVPHSITVGGRTIPVRHVSYQEAREDNFFTERSKREFSLRGLNKAIVYHADYGFHIEGETIDTIRFDGNTVFWTCPEGENPMKAVWQGRKKHTHQSWRIYYNYDDEGWIELNDQE